jgi:hypothetical protein
VLLGWGHLPYLVRAGRALVHLVRADAAQAKVYALNTNGKRLGEIPLNAGGSIPLSIGGDGQARMLYEVVFEK